MVILAVVAVLAVLLNSSGRNRPHAGEGHGAPAVTAVQPRQGPARGGTVVRIRGTGFLRRAGHGSCAANETVYFGADEQGNYPIPAAPGSVKILSDKEIEAATPENYGGTVAGSGQPGTVDVQVFSPNCGLSSPNPGDRYSFTYNEDGQCTSSHCYLNVNGAAVAGPLAYAADGFLDGFTDLAGAGRRATLSPTEIIELAQIHPRWWRFGYPGQGVSGLQVKQQLGVQTTELLESDYLATHPRQAPWHNLGQFAGFVRQDVQRYDAAGLAPTYWDVWNEPGCAHGAHGRPSSMSGTVNDYLSIYGAAYLAIKSVNPGAQIIGPSVGSFNLDSSPGTACGDDLTIADFLLWAALHHYRFAAVSYHDEAEHPPPEDRDAPFGRDDYRVGALGAHVVALRRLLARRYPQLGAMKIFVNEYGSWASLEPGWLVGAFGAFESSGAAEANLSCGGSGEASCKYLVDGLFANTQGVPAMPYWVFDDYANMTGNRIAVTSNGSNLTGLATRQDGTQTVEALVGRHDECAGPPRPYYTTGSALPPPPDSTCPEFQVPPHPASPVSVTLTVEEPYHVSRVSVSIQRLPNSATCEGTAPDLPPGCATAAVPTAPLSVSSIVPVVRGTVSMPLGPVRDGDAAFIILTPAG